MRWSGAAAVRRSASREAVIATRPDVESFVRDVVARLLGVDAVPADADFFALGGDSLLALEVTSAVQDELSFEVPLDLLFQHPTLAEFAARLEEMDGARADSAG